MLPATQLSYVLVVVSVCLNFQKGTAIPLPNVATRFPNKEHERQQTESAAVADVEKRTEHAANETPFNSPKLDMAKEKRLENVGILDENDYSGASMHNNKPGTSRNERHNSLSKLRRKSTSYPFKEYLLSSLGKHSDRKLKPNQRTGKDPVQSVNGQSNTMHVTRIVNIHSRLEEMFHHDNLSKHGNSSSVSALLDFFRHRNTEDFKNRRPDFHDLKSVRSPRSLEDIPEDWDELGVQTWQEESKSSAGSGGNLAYKAWMGKKFLAEANVNYTVFILAEYVP